MSYSIPISKARSSLPALCKKLNNDEDSEAVAITKKGKPVLALMNWEQYESIIETLEILGNKEQMAALRQGIKQAKAGKGISWESAKKALL